MVSKLRAKTPSPETESSKQSVPMNSVRLNNLFQRKKVSLPAIVQAEIATQIQRLTALGQGGLEYASTIDYVELLLDLPWQKQPQKRVNLKRAAWALDQTHFGMSQVKEKCIEFIAALNSGGKTGSILCLDGPPGVGKTSIAKSMANAMRRKSFVISLAGTHDNTLLHGHRRTWSGSLPGGIIQGLRKVGTSNPVIILDEGDKCISEGSSSNLAHALLEILDPDQNAFFKDHYLNLPFDLSDVTFIVTTNDVSMLPPPLLDRLEVIKVRPYTVEEKLAIAQNYLVPKHIQATGLSARQLRIKDDALTSLIGDYTSEPGVRNLDRHIRDICRKVNVAIQRGTAKSAQITCRTLEPLIGPPRIYKTCIPDQDMIGFANGLYFSSSGSGGLIPIQVALKPSHQFNLAVTGLAGPMINESARCVIEMLQSSADYYGIDVSHLRKTNIHIHLVDGASPKDGPSAGIAMATAVLSALRNVKVRRDVAMTGEVDLHGNILPIGGLPEKIEGARKAGVTKVLIPWANTIDLIDVPPELKNMIEILPVRHFRDVLAHALTGPLPKLDPRFIRDRAVNQNRVDTQEIAQALSIVSRALLAATDIEHPAKGGARAAHKSIPGQKPTLG
jgi:ATP-dependent Lon protease